MIPEWLSFIDVVFVAVGLLFACGGFQKGFAAQLAHILTFLALGVTLFFAYPSIFDYFRSVFCRVNETYLTWMILAGAVALSFIIFFVVSKLLQSLMKTKISERSDKAYGFLLGFFRGILIALFAMLFFVVLGSESVSETLCAKSYSGRFVCNQLAPPLQPHLTRESLGEKAQQLRDRLMEREEAGILE